MNYIQRLQPMTNGKRLGGAPTGSALMLLTFDKREYSLFRNRDASWYYTKSVEQVLSPHAEEFESIYQEWLKEDEC